MSDTSTFLGLVSEVYYNPSLQALLHSYSMIIVSEIGDKTFLIAGLLSMRHPRLTVFLGAFSSLMLMSLLSALLGHILPTLLPKTLTHLAAAGLFFVFGVKMLGEAREMGREEKEGGGGGKERMREEMREVEEEIEEDEREAGLVAEENHEDVENSLGSAQYPTFQKSIALEDMEQGTNVARSRAPSPGDSAQPATPTTPSHKSKKHRKGFKEGLRNFSSFLLGPVFVQAFVLTFLGEWGDRSQIATIALGAAHNVYLVTLGTILGHACCTALAVIGGRYISTKISVRHVTLGGSILFLLFGIIYLYEAYVMWGEKVDMDMTHVKTRA